MRRSDDRILTTHVGSLPRNRGADRPADPRRGRRDGRPRGAGAAERAARCATSSSGRSASGVDIVNDGEQPRVGFQTYVAQRMQGFGGEFDAAAAARLHRFPRACRRSIASAFPRRSKVSNAPQAIAEVAYEDLAPAEEECRMFRSALDKLPSPPADAFMTAASPGIIATTMLNAHYDSHEAYVFALARQMRKEYELIARDFVLQIDAPDLAMERTVLFQDKTAAEFLKIAEMHVAALNEALAGIPRERVRLHCCWGNYDGPHIHDIPLSDILPVLYQAQGRRAQHRVRQSAPSARISPRSRRRSCRPSSCCCRASSIRRRTSSSIRKSSPTGSARRSTPSATAAASSPRATAASAPSPARNWSPRTSCGPSSRAAARAPTSRRGACGAERRLGAAVRPQPMDLSRTRGSTIEAPRRDFRQVSPGRARRADIGHLVGRPGFTPQLPRLGAGRRTRGLPGLFLAGRCRAR